MEIVKLPVSLREGRGSAESRRMRRSGQLPGILYGLKRDPIALSVDSHVFELAFERGQRVFDLSLDGSEKRRIALLKDVQHNAVGDRVLHVDFLRVDEEADTEVSVALNFEGQPQAVSGATLEVIRAEIEVRCKPRSIPEKVDVVLSGLQVGDTITAAEVTLPEKVELATEPDTVLVTFNVHHGKAETEESGEVTEGEGEDEGETPEA